MARNGTGGRSQVDTPGSSQTTVYDRTPGLADVDDYVVVQLRRSYAFLDGQQTLTVWGKGVVSLGNPTDAQRAAMAAWHGGDLAAVFGSANFVAAGASGLSFNTVTVGGGSINSLDENGSVTGSYSYDDPIVWRSGGSIARLSLSDYGFDTSHGADLETQVHFGAYSYDQTTTTQPVSSFRSVDFTVVQGTAGNDSLVTSSGVPQTLIGNGGNDSFSVTNGVDAKLIGGSGDDTFSGSGYGTAYGDAGDDTFMALDRAFGGAGNDAFTYVGQAYGGDGADTFHMRINDLAVGGGGADVYYAGENSVILFERALDSTADARDFVHNMSSTVTIRVDGPTVTGISRSALADGTYVTNLTTAEGTISLLSDAIIADRQISATFARVPLNGTSGDDIISAQVGQPAVYGFGGNDSLMGNGNAVLYGGAGDDSLSIEYGDVAVGGAGADTIFLSSSATIRYEAVSDSTSLSRDTIAGSSGTSPTIDIGDLIVERVAQRASGDFTVYDLTTASGTLEFAISSVLTPTFKGNFILGGTAGSDTLAAANGGTNVLTGGAGGDVLLAVPPSGTGTTVFRYLSPNDSPASGGAIDTIGNFDGARDRIDATAITGINGFSITHESNGSNTLLLTTPGGSNLKISVFGVLTSDSVLANTTLYAVASQDQYYGTGGNDTIYAADSHLVRRPVAVPDNGVLDASWTVERSDVQSARPEATINVDGGHYTFTTVADGASFEATSLYAGFGGNSFTGSVTVSDADGVGYGSVDGYGDLDTTLGAAGTYTVDIQGQYDLELPADALRIAAPQVASGTMVHGGTGNDILVSGSGADVLDGGAGEDTASFMRATAGVVVDLAAGTATGHGSDVLVRIEDVNGSAYADTLAGDMHNNIIDGGAGNDVIHGGGLVDTLYGGDGNDAIDGGADGDYVLGGLGDDNMFGGDGVDLLGGEAGSDTIHGGADGDNIYGGAGSDMLFGDDGADSIDGQEDGDFILGGLGDDHLFGGPGSDLLGGEGGNDELHGGIGDDNLYGGAGTDMIYGEDGNDSIDGQEGGDYILGGVGNDTIHGGSGVDLVGGEAGNDLLFGGDGADNVYGGDGADQLFGEAGNDFLSGGAGNDLIAGNGGSDRLEGGAGSDTFYYFSTVDSSSAGGADVVTDFLSGTDIIDLSAIDADTTTPGDQAFTFQGITQTPGDAATLRVGFIENVGIFLFGNTDHDPAADFILNIGTFNVHMGDLHL